MHRESKTKALATENREWHRVKITLTSDSLNASARCNASVRWKDGVLEIDGLPERNNPRKTQEFTHLIQSNLNDYSFQIESATSFSPKTSDAGYLKTAYLAAFCKFGYQYILRQELESVRKQIQNPQIAILSNYRLTLGGDDTTAKKILLVNSPVDALVVQLGTIGILFPSVNAGSDNVYTDLNAATSADRTQINYNDLAWPAGMEMIFDKQPVVRPNGAHEADT